MRMQAFQACSSPLCTCMLLYVVPCSEAQSMSSPVFQHKARKGAQEFKFEAEVRLSRYSQAPSLHGSLSGTL